MAGGYSSLMMTPPGMTTTTTIAASGRRLFVPTLTAFSVVFVDDLCRFGIAPTLTCPGDALYLVPEDNTARALALAFGQHPVADRCSGEREHECGGKYQGDNPSTAHSEASIAAPGHCSRTGDRGRIAAPGRCLYD